MFSYIKPTLTEVAGMRIDRVLLMLTLFGVGMVRGNLAGARLADEALMRTVGGVMVHSVLVLLAFTVTARHWLAASINVLLLGTLGAIALALQIRPMDVPATPRP